MIPRIFCCDWFNFHVETWSDENWAFRNLPPPTNYSSTGGPEVKDVTCEVFLEHLEDPRKRKGGFTKWKGKILPEPMVDNIKSSSVKDDELLSEFFDVIGETDSPLVNRIKFLWSRTKNAFDLMKQNDYKDKLNEALMRDLGIGMRKRI